MLSSTFFAALIQASAFLKSEPKANDGVGPPIVEKSPRMAWPALINAALRGSTKLEASHWVQGVSDSISCQYAGCSGYTNAKPPGIVKLTSRTRLARLT